MEVRFFGEFEAVEGGVPVPVRGAKQRTVLALLALHRGQPVSTDRLIDAIWGDGQVATGRAEVPTSAPRQSHLRPSAHSVFSTKSIEGRKNNDQGTAPHQALRQGGCRR